MSKYSNNLISTVLSLSSSKEWGTAVEEWSIISCSEDRSCTTRCVCGKEGLRYLFRLRNNITGNILFPIGSSCINKFGIKSLMEEASVRESLFKLLHAVEENGYVQLNSDFFSRKLLKYLYFKGAFPPNQYNKGNGYNDYQFMLDMFNKRTRITDAQRRKVSAILVNSILPYLRSTLEVK